VERVALSQPGIAFKMIQDGSVKFETTGDGNLKNAIYSIFGRDFATRLIETNSEIDGVRVSGFIGRSDNFKSNRNYQNFFINGRYVKSKTASAALEQAYSSYIPSEKYPCCVLNIEVSPRAVDVNVHPAKLEVKFSNEKPVFDAVYYTVRSALEDDISRPDFQFEKQKATESKKQNVSNAFVPVEDLKKSYPNLQISFDGAFGKAQVSPRASEKVETAEAATPVKREEKKPETVSARTEKTVPPITAEKPIVTYDPAMPGDKDAPVIYEAKPKSESVLLAKPAVVPKQDTATQVKHRAEVGDYRIVGEVFHSYVIVECGDKMIVIDKHAAHERILFEELRSYLEKSEASSQLLMLPIEVMLTTDEVTALEGYRAEIEKIGFLFTLKKHSAEITAIPSNVDSEAVCDMFIAIADRILSDTGSVEVSRKLVFERALYQASCKAAIKAGREYPVGHITWLVDKMMKMPDITFCPHGRPVAVEMTKSSMDKQFERK
jgi:DNA mismatch repair protein MutL